MSVLYKEATESLIDLNEIYPSYGDYIQFHVSPTYDKIKKNTYPLSILWITWNYHQNWIWEGQLSCNNKGEITGEITTD